MPWQDCHQTRSMQMCVSLYRCDSLKHRTHDGAGGGRLPPSWGEWSAARLRHRTSVSGSRAALAVNCALAGQRREQPRRFQRHAGPAAALPRQADTLLLTSKKGGAAKGCRGAGEEAAAGGAKPQMTQTEDILNSILPPRRAPSAAPRLHRPPPSAHPRGLRNSSSLCPPPRPPPRSEWTEDGQGAVRLEHAGRGST